MMRAMMGTFRFPTHREKSGARLKKRAHCAGCASGKRWRERNRGQSDQDRVGKGTTHDMQGLTLEICVDSVESARAAEAGGADRIELCAELDKDGVTPPAELICAVRSAVGLDVYTMVRPRAGNFVYSAKELDAMLAAIEKAGALGADGVVLGALTAAGEVDVAAVRRLVEAARPMPVTFHRAFDVAADLDRALDQVMETGADRVLTSGGKKSAAEAKDVLARLVQAANGTTRIMAGGGIRRGNVHELVMATDVREVHTSMGFGDRGAGRFVVCAGDVRAMRETLDAIEVASAARR